MRYEDYKEKVFAERPGVKREYKKFEVKESKKQRLIMPVNIGDHCVNRLLARDILKKRSGQNDR